MLHIQSISENHQIKLEVKSGAKWNFLFNEFFYSVVFRVCFKYIHFHHLQHRICTEEDFICIFTAATANISISIHIQIKTDIKLNANKIWNLESYSKYQYEISTIALKVIDIECASGKFWLHQIFSFIIIAWYDKMDSMKRFEEETSHQS